MNRLQTGSRDDRGVSDIVGTILMVGFVVALGALLVFAGLQVFDSHRSTVEREQASTMFQSIDGRMSETAKARTNGTVSLSPRLTESVQLVSNGSITIAIDGGRCTATVPTGSIRYELEDGSELAFEGGGVWLRSESGTVVRSPPDLTYRNRTVSLWVYSLSGNISGTDPGIRNFIGQSSTETASVSSGLFADDACRRPDNLTLTVQSEYYRGWGQYLETEFGTPVTYDDSNRTVETFLNSSMLPLEADDDRNQVIDYTKAPWNGTVRTSTVFSVDKGVNNTYPVGIRLLSAGTQGGKAEIDTRDPIDVMFTIDTSGSMDDSAGGWTTVQGPVNAADSRLEYYDFGSDDYEFVAEPFERVLVESGGNWTELSPSDSGWRFVSGSFLYGKYYDDPTVLTPDRDILVQDDRRLPAAQAASKHFVGLLNSSAGDRTGVTTFSGDDGDAVLEQVLTDDFGATNASIDSLSAGGGTPMEDGIRTATTGFTSNPSPEPDADRYMVLLSDGEASYSSTAELAAAARDAKADNITIYTVGFQISTEGKENLQAIANATNGTYYPADNTTHLQAQFAKIVAEIKPTLVQSDPYTIDSGSQFFLPNQTISNGTGDITEYDLNDPEITEDLGFGTSISDGGTFTLNLTQYPCERWNATDEPITYENGTNVTNEQGLPYYKSRCVVVNESATPRTLTLTADSDRVLLYTARNTTGDLPPGAAKRPWERDLEGILADAGLVNETSGSLTLDSNQVVFATELRASDGDVETGDFNDVVLLIDVGYGNEDVSVRWAVDVRVAVIRVGA